MTYRIENTSYAGFKAITLESSVMSVTVIPELGAKIVSMLYKPTSKEWLIGAGSRGLRTVDYGSDYGQADLSGWDECCPTIVACDYPAQGPFHGRALPDHGELWSIPWSARVEGEAVTCEVEGRALPYSFSRTLSYVDDDTFRMAYRLTNLSDEPLSLFWCAHPLFRATEHTEMIMPDEVTELLCVDGGKHLTAGKKYAWPDGDGQLRGGLSRIGSAESKDSRKFYVDGKVEQGVTGLYEQDSKEYLILEWLPEQLPYLGAWINEGEVMEEAVCALEPCNGFYDKLDDAYGRDQLLHLSPRQTAEWQLDVRLGRGAWR
ncbi:hypothetical protein ACFO9Q_07955 [Paenibacillus sp. GCM10023252]|uniref:hypothetical protein n=1 Tax=Paenibacillus sp. GCM10023252 TaxID=3252649 RepID=UPI003613CB99